MENVSQNLHHKAWRRENSVTVVMTETVDLEVTKTVTRATPTFITVVRSSKSPDASSTSDMSRKFAADQSEWTRLTGYEQ